MFLAPTSGYLRQRAIEDGDPLEELQERLRGAVRLATKVYEQIWDLHSGAERERKLLAAAVGSIEIRVTDFCPHFAIYRPIIRSSGASTRLYRKASTLLSSRCRPLKLLSLANCWNISTACGYRGSAERRKIATW